MYKRLGLFYAIIFITIFISCDLPPFVKIESYTFNEETSIDRTLWLLNSSTKESPNELEILFYGQSIIAGLKAEVLIDSLRDRFPYSKITFKQKSIGGFTVPSLIKTAEHDLYHENPDLIIFHAYGGIYNNLYDSLIKNIRSNMSSEVMLLDHHYVWDKPRNKLISINKRDDIASDTIKCISRKYNCELVEVRKNWGMYLSNNGMEPNMLMGNTKVPNIHPNDKGNELLRSIILSKFKLFNHKQTLETDSLRVELNLQETSNSISFNGFGNKVYLYTKEIKHNPSKALILIDEMRPSAHRSNYIISRPSKAYNHWQPALKRVCFGSEFPREENWTIELFNFDRKNNEFEYKVTGDISGFDGYGNSHSDFISNSRRISIDKEDFNIFNAERLSKLETPDKFNIRFNVKKIVEDTLYIQPNKNKYLLYMDKASKNHTIEINKIFGDAEFEKALMLKPYVL